MEVALLKTKLLDARTEILNKDHELALLDDELQRRLRSMEDITGGRTKVGGWVAKQGGDELPVNKPQESLPPRSGDRFRHAHAGLTERCTANNSSSLAGEISSLRAEVRHHEARMASQLAGLSAGARALASQLAHEREERKAAIAELRREFSQGSTQEGHLAGLDASFGMQRPLPVTIEEPLDLELAKLKERVDTMSEQMVSKADSQWLQASETMVSLSETCGQLCSEVSLLTSRVDALKPEQEQPPSDKVPEDTDQLPPKELTQSVRALENEVALLAKAIISGSQELSVRLAEERSVRRAAEAVLDARIKTVEHQVKRLHPVSGLSAASAAPDVPSSAGSGQPGPVLQAA